MPEKNPQKSRDPQIIFVVSVEYKQRWDAMIKDLNKELPPETPAIGTSEIGRILTRQWLDKAKNKQMEVIAEHRSEAILSTVRPKTPLSKRRQ